MITEINRSIHIHLLRFPFGSLPFAKLLLPLGVPLLGLLGLCGNRLSRLGFLLLHHARRFEREAAESTAAKIVHQDTASAIDVDNTIFA